MFTPAMLLETASSRAVTWRVQPPVPSRTCASEKEKRRFGNVPWSVDGGRSMSGFCMSRMRLRGPGSVPPWPGRIGCGREVASCAADAVDARPATADAANRLRREIGSMSLSCLLKRPVRA
jgi:hypothetical protein